MPGESIGEYVRREIDGEIHKELISDAWFLITHSEDNKPRVDNGERWIYVQAQIDAIREDRSRSRGYPLRRVTIEFNKIGQPFPRLEPLPPLLASSQPAKHGK
ncbi:MULTISPECIES: hypothetical protein [Phyllobacteriaceae]|jgi:hypothetical protein|uniref:Uncharacterized protein n=1 Tax=Mesorhizobium hungaricum TaxID=1566387 RepID=A0A1C2DD41_9HYPH|nr:MULTISPECIES: hypothetical protein [Mesorhizobium]MBN9235123.1 hypothetical protein [Mesorhizobium sp.]OCX12678.1 hypothetical protein QV13_24075 [Mesorhizobium hungaricum]